MTIVVAAPGFLLATLDFQPPYAMVESQIHRLVVQNNLPALREMFRQSDPRFEIENRNSRGYTPLMLAVQKAVSQPEMVQFLIEHGANVREDCGQGGMPSLPVIGFAVRAGDPAIVRLLLASGATLHYRKKSGIGVLLDAVHFRDVFRDPRLIDLLQLLIAEKVELSGISECQESGLRVLSRLGRFDGVKVLLDGGADAEQLRWSPLMFAVALGSVADVRRELDSNAELEGRDWWERTPWLLALHAGDVAKAILLLEHGANPNVVGRCQKPPLFYPISTFQSPMLQWLLERGVDTEQKDEFGHAALHEAVEEDNVEAVEILLAHGADLTQEWRGETVLADIRSRTIGRKLLQAGADPRHLSMEGQRLLLGLPIEYDELQLQVTLEEFRHHHTPRFGTANPEPMNNRFYEEMIRSGRDASNAAAQFGSDAEGAHPVWCAMRFGQTITFLGDGRIVQIGGEHEDFYDPDFKIYNDVFVHRPSGGVEIYGYPLDIFPPTDFHTATLIGERAIWIVGGLGYNGERKFGTTPVYRLEVATMKIEKVKTTGPCPGWIHRHTARLTTSSEIKITGGEIIRDENEESEPNEAAFVLDTASSTWRQAD